MFIEIQLLTSRALPPDRTDTGASTTRQPFRDVPATGESRGGLHRYGGKVGIAIGSLSELTAEKLVETIKLVGQGPPAEADA